MRKAPKPKQNGNSNAIILDWVITGKRYTLSPPGKWSNPKDVERATRLGETIYEDYKTRNFDSTLRKYKSPEQISGECTPQIQFKKGFYRIYLKYNGERLDINAGQTEERAREFAKQLEQDCMNGCVDTTLKKYTPESVIADFTASNQRRIEQEYQKATQYRASLELYREFAEIKLGELQYSSAAGYRQLLGKLEELPEIPMPKNPTLEDRLKTNFPYNADSAKRFLKSAKSIKKGTPLSQKTQKNYAACFTAFGKWLVQYKSYPQNPYFGLEVKVSERPKPKPFTIEEANQIIDYFYAKHPLYANFVCLRFLTGLRSGELSGLKWSHIDWENQVFLIYESITQAGEKGKLIEKATKTEKLRPIYFTPEIVEVFKRQKEVLAQKPHLKDHQLVFPNEYANPINSSHFCGKYWNSALEALEIPREGRNPYKTRHTFGNHALKSGMRPEDVARIMGHDVQTFFKHYEGEISRPEMPRLGLNIPTTNSEEP